MENKQNIEFKLMLSMNCWVKFFLKIPISKDIKICRLIQRPLTFLSNLFMFPLIFLYSVVDGKNLKWSNSFNFQKNYLNELLQMKKL